MAKIFSLKKTEFYNSIDEMPIYNWLKIQETNDISWVLKVKGDVKKIDIPILEHALELMTDQYIDTFGIGDKYRSILRLQGELRCREIDYITTQDRVHLTFIEIKKAELKMAIQQSQKQDKVSVKVHAEKYMGRAINMKETSVKDFYEILEELKREQKQKD